MQRNGQYPNQQTNSSAGPNRTAPNMPHAQGGPLQPGAPQQMNHQHPQNAQHANANMTPRGPHLGVPQMGVQGNIPQAQMQPNMRPGVNGQSQADNMQQRVLDAQRAAQMKMNGQHYQMAPPNRMSPGGMHVPNGVMANQSNQPMMSGMQNQANRTPVQHAQNHQVGPNGSAASPHMPPPPTPTGHSQQPQQLSSGHVPAISQIAHQIQAQNPSASQEKIKELTDAQLRQYLAQRDQQQQHNTHQHARQSALSAAAGPHAVSPAPNGTPTYGQNQATFHQTNVPNGQQTQYNNGNNGGNNNGSNGANAQPPAANSQQYSAMMRQRLMAQQSQLQQQAPGTPVQANGSPRVAQANPGMVAPSPNMTASHPQQQSIPPNANSRTPTPQMARMGSSQGGVTSSTTPQPPNQQHPPSTMHQPSPGAQQGSPRPVSAGVSRS